MIIKSDEKGREKVIIPNGEGGRKKGLPIRKRKILCGDHQGGERKRKFVNLLKL